MGGDGRPHGEGGDGHGDVLYGGQENGGVLNMWSRFRQSLYLVFDFRAL